MGAEVTEATDLTSISQGVLEPSMDIFSVGCVIAGIFTDGKVPFEFSQLLDYIEGKYTLDKYLADIKEDAIVSLVAHMLQKEPQSRHTASEYLNSTDCFPAYFSSYLYPLLERYAIMEQKVPAEDRIHILASEISDIMKELESDDHRPGLVIFLSLVLSCIRALKHSDEKLQAIHILDILATKLPTDIVLDRMLPYMLNMLHDASSQVKTEAIKMIAKCLSNIEDIRDSDVSLFSDVIFPEIRPLVSDPDVAVRTAYAANISTLACSANRFLSRVHTVLDDASMIVSLSDQQDAKINAYKQEQLALVELLDPIVVDFLLDSENVVKQTLLESGFADLAVFFGVDKASDCLLSHMITFLNDKDDWLIRDSFFNAILAIALLIGAHSSPIFLPLLQQGLHDGEESIVYKTLCTMTLLSSCGLLLRNIVNELFKEALPFLYHPNLWIQHACVGFISMIAKQFGKNDIPYVECQLKRKLRPYLKNNVRTLKEPPVLLTMKKPHISREIYDYILRSNQMEQLFEVLADRKIERDLTRTGHKPNYSAIDEKLQMVFRKLNSLEMKEEDEDKLLDMKDIMLKLHKAKPGTTNVTPTSSGLLSLNRHKTPNLSTKYADLVQPSHKKSEYDFTRGRSPRPNASGTGDITGSMNEDWKQMFGSTASDLPRSQSSLTMSRTEEDLAAAAGAVSSSVTSSVIDGASITDSTSSKASSVMSATDSPRRLVADQQRIHSPSQSPQLQHTRRERQTTKQQQKENHKHRPAVRASLCQTRLHQLVTHRRKQYQDVQLTDMALEIFRARPKCAPWRPQGLLVAHLHEHSGAVNKLKVSDDGDWFVTCSNDASVKLWEGARLEGRSINNRSRVTYTKTGGQVKCVTFLQQTHKVAAASDKGNIHVFRMDTGSSKGTKELEHTVDLTVDGHITDITHFDSGSQSLLAYSTVSGKIIGLDLRMRKLVAWTLHNEQRHGLINTFDVHGEQTWLAVGTSSGIHNFFDLRFQLPISKTHHPLYKCIRRVLTHPGHQSLLFSASRGNNEVSLWDAETGTRQLVLWASSAPPLDTQRSSIHSTNGLCFGETDRNQFVLTAGSDMRVRYWDLSAPQDSYIVVGAASDPPINKQPIVSYREQTIDGNDVIYENYRSMPAASSGRGGAANRDPTAPDDGQQRGGPDVPAKGHHDIITDIAMCRASQSMFITASRDGVVKVWK